MREKVVKENYEREGYEKMYIWKSYERIFIFIFLEKEKVKKTRWK